MSTQKSIRKADIRKIVVQIEETLKDTGKTVSGKAKVTVAAVIKNPFAGAYHDDLEPLYDLGKEISGILAECGGACCCATCHVHIDPDWMGRLPEMDDDEKDMLEFAEGIDDFSRLSCQLKITDELDGLVVNVPESQY